MMTLQLKTGAQDTVSAEEEDSVPSDDSSWDNAFLQASVGFE